MYKLQKRVHWPGKMSCWDVFGNACPTYHIKFKYSKRNFPFTEHAIILSKVYRLGGETDSPIRWRKRTSCDVGERPEEAGC